MAGGSGGTRGSPCESAAGPPARSSAGGTSGRKLGEDVGEIFPETYLGCEERLSVWLAGGGDNRRLASLSLPQTTCRVRARRHIGLPSWACGLGLLVSLSRARGWPGLCAVGPLRQG